MKKSLNRFLFESYLLKQTEMEPATRRLVFLSPLHAWPACVFNRILIRILDCHRVRHCSKLMAIAMRSAGCSRSSVNEIHFPKKIMGASNFLLIFFFFVCLSFSLVRFLPLFHFVPLTFQCKWMHRIHSYQMIFQSPQSIKKSHWMPLLYICLLWLLPINIVSRSLLPLCHWMD